MVGLVLVLGSTVLGARVVAAADDTVPVYLTTRALASGEALSSHDVRVGRARLPDGAAGYLLADEPLPADVVVRHQLGPGELVAVEMLGDAGSVRLQPVGVPVSSRLPSTVRKGSSVELWAAEPDPEASGRFLAPRRLVSGVEVAELQEGGTSLGASTTTTVQVLLAGDEVAPVLEALANDAAVTVLPVGQA
ncbi:MAG: hypothetical protein ACK5MT_21160 [Actinomycetales bacterium]